VGRDRDGWRGRDTGLAPTHSQKKKNKKKSKTGADGFATRFGITYVDYKDDQKRYPKDSFKYLSNLWGAGGGAALPDKYKPSDGAASEPPSPKTP
jgi:hypothetical protein